MERGSKSVSLAENMKLNIPQFERGGGIWKTLSKREGG